MKSGRHQGERGQTILLVAISIVALLGMAALAIDVVSLYVARSEIQRAADAAALVGAKAIADSGITSLPPGNPNVAAGKALAQSMANSAINALLGASPGVNQVAGGQPVTIAGTPTIVYNDPSGNNLTNNPIITVQLQRAGLPTFFARIFGRSASTTSATAMAEAYNPANMASFTPVAPRCVKPWLVANADPASGSPFITDLSTGQVETGAVGEKFSLIPDCNPGPGSSCQLIHNPPGVPAPLYVEYVPALVTASPTNVCPSACAGPTPYEQSISCCDMQLYSCGGTTTNATWDSTVSPNPNFGGTGSTTSTATQCLIHATSTGFSQGQDFINDFRIWPTAGAPQITAGSGPMNGQLVSTSDSVVTVPIIDTCTTGGCFPNTSAPVTVIGFLQTFVEAVVDNGTNRRSSLQVTVLNVVGCSRTPNGANAITGGNGASAIAVRLITNTP